MGVVFKHHSQGQVHLKKVIKMILKKKKHLSIRHHIQSLRYSNVYMVWSLVCPRKKDCPEPPEIPVNVEWIKDHFELSWKPPKNLISTNDLEYLVEMEYKPGSWKTLGKSRESRVSVYDYDFYQNSRLKFKIYAKNRFGMSEPLIFDKLFSEFANEKMFEDNKNENV